MSLLDGGWSLFLFSCLLRAIYTSWDNVEFSNMSHFSAFRSLLLFNLQRSWANIRKQGKRRNRCICCCIISFKQARLFIIKWWNVSIVIWQHSETYSKAYSSLSIWKRVTLHAGFKTFLGSFFLRISHLDHNLYHFVKKIINTIQYFLSIFCQILILRTKVLTAFCDICSKYNKLN